MRASTMLNPPSLPRWVLEYLSPSWLARLKYLVLLARPHAVLGARVARSHVVLGVATWGARCPPVSPAVEVSVSVRFSALCVVALDVFPGTQMRAPRPAPCAPARALCPPPRALRLSPRLPAPAPGRLRAQ